MNIDKDLYTFKYTYMFLYQTSRGCGNCKAFKNQKLYRGETSYSSEPFAKVFPSPKAVQRWKFLALKLFVKVSFLLSRAFLLVQPFCQRFCSKEGSAFCQGLEGFCQAFLGLEAFAKPAWATIDFYPFVKGFSSLRMSMAAAGKSEKQLWSFGCPFFLLWPAGTMG